MQVRITHSHRFITSIGTCELTPVYLGHCLESLRQSVMCVPDLVPRPVFWEDKERSNIAANPSVKHQCLDWGSLNAWMETRQYTLRDLLEENPLVETVT